MAVTTINEKLALITYLQPWNTPLPISSDGLDQADNQHLIWEYPGVLWSSIAELEMKYYVTPLIVSKSYTTTLVVSKEYSNELILSKNYSTPL